MMDGTLFYPYRTDLSYIMPTSGTHRPDGTWTRRIAQAQMRAAGRAGSVVATLRRVGEYGYAQSPVIEVAPRGYFYGTRPPFLNVAVQYGTSVWYRKIAYYDTTRGASTPYFYPLSFRTWYTARYNEDFVDRWSIVIYHEALFRNWASPAGVGLLDTSDWWRKWYIYNWGWLPNAPGEYNPYEHATHTHVILHWYAIGAHPYIDDGTDTPTFWIGGTGTWGGGTGTGGGAAGPVTYLHSATYQESWWDQSTFAMGIPTGTGLYTAVVISYFGNDPFNAWLDGTLGTFLGSKSDVYPNIAMWGFLNPPTGTKNVSATFSGYNGIQYTVLTFAGVNQTTPTGSVCLKSEAWAATVQYYSPCGTGNVVAGGLTIGNSGYFNNGANMITVGNWGGNTLVLHNYATYVSGSTVDWMYSGTDANSIVSMSVELQQA